MSEARVAITTTYNEMGIIIDTKAEEVGQPDHNADISKKVSISCGRENDLISRQEALKKLAAYIHLIDKTMGKGTLTDDDCLEAAKSVLGEDELPAVQPELHWIPCSERLPEVGHVVLWCNQYGSVFASEIVFANEHSWYIGNRHRGGDPIAWMPLPNPYNGGDSE